MHSPRPGRSGAGRRPQERQRRRREVARRRDIALRGSSIEAFAASLRGDVLLAGSPDYDARRRVWNGSFDKHPALIASCTGASDVRHAVDFAREHQLLTAVRAGGHSLSGKSTCDGGLVIDLQQMQGVRVDPEAKRAYPRGRLAARTARPRVHGIWPRDRGGHGVRHRRRGPNARRRIWPRSAGDSASPATTSLHSTSSPPTATSSARATIENPDLLWGLRGGGGNFGVVTTIEYRLHLMNPIDSRWVRRLADGPGA